MLHINEVGDWKTWRYIYVWNIHLYTENIHNLTTKCIQSYNWNKNMTEISDELLFPTMQPQPHFHLFSLFVVTYACRNLTFPNSKNCECIKSPAVFDLIKLSFHSSFVILIQSVAPQSGRAIDWTQPWNQMYQTWLHTCEWCVNVCPSATKHYTIVSSSVIPKSVTCRILWTQ